MAATVSLLGGGAPLTVARRSGGAVTKQIGQASPRLFMAIVAAVRSGCMVGPNYQRPNVPMPTVYKEAIGWSPAQPSDAAPVSDVLSAQTQLASSQGDDTDLAQQRAKLEHAIALLTGCAPSTLTLSPIAWAMPTPDIPSDIPSRLLQRRRDVAAAAAERRAAAAETVFDAGARSAKAKQSRAAYDQAVADYRQTVLTVFGQVEDALAAQRVLGAEQAPRDAAVSSANRNERISLNQYKAEQVDYTTVVVAQVAALSARAAALQNQASRLAAAVTLINASGGGWTLDGRPPGATDAAASAAPTQSRESE